MPIITGTAHWAKVIGDPKPGYDGNTREWSIDVAIDEKTVEFFKENGLSKRLKNKDDGGEHDKGDFVTFKRKEFKYQKSPSDDLVRNLPIRIVDHQKNPWPEDVLIGNGSKVNINFSVNDGKFGLQPSILSIQVVKLVEYEGGDQEDFGTYTDTGEVEEWT